MDEDAFDIRQLYLFIVCEHVGSLPCNPRLEEADAAFLNRKLSLSFLHFQVSLR